MTGRARDSVKINLFTFRKQSYAVNKKESEIDLSLISELKVLKTNVIGVNKSTL